MVEKYDYGLSWQFVLIVLIIESFGSFLGIQLMIRYSPPFLSVSTVENSTNLYLPLSDFFISILIISSFSFCRILDFPPQLIRAFLEVIGKKESSFIMYNSSSILHPD